MSGHIHCDRCGKHSPACSCPSGGDECACRPEAEIIRLLDACDRKNQGANG